MPTKNYFQKAENIRNRLSTISVSSLFEHMLTIFLIAYTYQYTKRIITH